jgi:hypothetical protein
MFFLKKAGFFIVDATGNPPSDLLKNTLCFGARGRLVLRQVHHNLLTWFDHIHHQPLKIKNSSDAGGGT